MARTSVDNTIQRIRRQAAGGYRHETQLLATAMDTATTSVVLVQDLTNNLQIGALVCIGIETMRVTAVNVAARTLTVIRGYYDSDPAAHSVNDEVWINPRYQPIDIYDAMIAELQSWGPALYAVKGQTIVVAANAKTVELPAAFVPMYGIIQVNRNWAVENTTAWPDLPVRLMRGVGTTFTGAPTSGLLVRFLECAQDGSVYVTAAMPFTVSAISPTNDLVADVGLAETQLDVLELGVKLRMGMDAEAQRSNRTAQDEPRRAQETPVGADNAGFQLSNAIYRNRKAEEIQKLRAKYPIRYS